ncbi:MAG: DUF1552 domain-containing protein [Sandaracinaceae bacterium]
MTKKKHLPLSRRTALRGLGAGVALAPFLPLLNASGQEPVIPRRLVLFFTPHGTLFDRWTPTGSGTDFTLSPLLAPLERFKDRITVIDHMAIREGVGPGAPHTKGPALLWTASPLLAEDTFTRADGSGGMYFGWNSEASFDQVLAARLRGATTFDSLELGVRSGGGFPGAHMIYAGPRTPVAPVADPNSLFDQLFAEALSPTEERDRRLAARRAVLGHVRDELRPLATRVGSADRIKIEQHYESLIDLERTLVPELAACTVPMRPGDRGAVDVTPWTFDRQIELLTSALACDLTRIASLQYRVGENDGYTYPWLALPDTEHHITTHSTEDVDHDKLAVIYTWYADRFAYLLERLDAVTEGDGTMLDHTMVIWGSELGTGRSHDFGRVPFVVAGGNRHGVRTGQFVDAGGDGHNRLIVSAMRFMGATDVDAYGATDEGRGAFDPVYG